MPVVALCMVASTIGTTGIPDAGATPLLTGFRESEVVRGITSPTGVNVAPDGRIFVSQQSGKLRVIKDGTLLPTPFLTVPVSQTVTAGLMGVAFDPQFPQQPYVYVFYTASSPTRHSRVSRFTAQGDVAAAGSEVVLLDLPTLQDVPINHDGGDLAFGQDGKLYVTVGDNLYSLNGQNLNTTFGKLLRINRDGTIPTDNPYYSSAAGNNRAIYASGLRNPFKLAVQPGTGRMFVNDVGNASWEEVNEVSRSANFGWSATEGPTSDPRFQGPLFAYSHTTGDPTGCAVTGGAFYNPTTSMLPADYIGDYFLADYCENWIGVLDLPHHGSPTFTKVADISTPVDLDVDLDGSLLVLSQANNGTLVRLSYQASAQVPTITDQPVDRSVFAGDAASFECAASGTPAPSIKWQRDGIDIPGVSGGVLNLSGVTEQDDGASFRCIASNSSGTATSDSAILSVTVPSQAPTATILSPAHGSEYAAGDTIVFSGSGTDPEDGALPPSAYRWEVVFHHDEHTHPFLLPLSGVTSGSMTVPVIGETDVDQWYRIRLTVTDSGGNTDTVERDIYPRTSTFTIRTDPPGLSAVVDGQPTATPAVVHGVVGAERTIGVITPQFSGGTNWSFGEWSNGGTQVQTIEVTSTSQDFEARFAPAVGSDRVVEGVLGLWDFAGGSGTTVADVSGRGVPLDLVIEDPSHTRWTDGGLSLDRPTRVVSSTPASKLVDAAKTSDEFTLEAWVTPTNVSDSYARIAGIIRDPWSRNAELMQVRSSVSSRLRSSLVEASMTTPNALNVGEASHVVMTRAPDGATRLFVDGQQVAQATSWGDLSKWDATLPFLVGNVPAGNQRAFLGTIHLVAFYDRALSTTEVDRNYDAGPRMGGLDVPPTVETDPRPVSTTEGAMATFSVTASGSAPLQYQWFRDDVALIGATSPQLTVGPLSPSDDGAHFTVVVSNPFGSATSAAAELRVTGSDRVVEGVLGLWDFAGGSGTTVADVSGRGVPLDLVIEDPSHTRWTDGGLSLDRPTRVVSSTPASKLVDAAKTSDEFTLEAWVTPTNVSDSYARIAGIIRDPWSRNAELMQVRSSVSSRLRSSLVEASMTTPNALNVGEASHVVMTRAPDGATRLFVDGQQVAQATSWGDLSKWDATLPFLVGNVPAGNQRAFLGTIHLVAFYDRALSTTEVDRNYDAGP